MSTAPMRAALRTLAARQRRSGALLPEPLSSDLGGAADGVPAQVVAWAGLRAMAGVWTATGHLRMATQARALGNRLEVALRRSVAQDEVRLADGSLFVPLVFGGASPPFGRVTFTRAGSYWNLLMPYAFATGFFAPGTRDTNAILRYLALHGTRLLGVTRADAHISFFGGGQGLGQVYGLEASRFLADNDQADELALALYGMLGTAMTPTYMSGEAISVVPVAGSWYRTMYMPPNLGANSTYLETLRLLLVHEAPRELDLAFSTPRSWLDEDGHFGVRAARTRFGRVSYQVRRRDARVEVSADIPRAPVVRLRLRVPPGTYLRSVRLRGRPLHVEGGETVTLPKRGHVVLEATLGTSLAGGRPATLH